MDRALFGTDGIRGLAGVYPLDEAGAEQVGRAIASYFARPGEVVLVGRDPRESSPMLEQAVVSGLTALGVNCELTGIIPTPGLAYLTSASPAVAGVVITASHNPYTDNGIKVFSGDGTKLPDHVETELNKLIDSQLENKEPSGSTKATDRTEQYKTFLVSTAGEIDLDNMRLAVDCANGATSFTAPAVLEQLGAKVTPLFNQPDGVNINQACGAGHIEALQQAVTSQDLDGGVAFDGDGDRVILVDEKGRALTGDHILYILAVCRRAPGIVATVMSNMGLETALQKQNIILHRTAVGDRYVLEGLAQTGFTLGGEQSGHIILLDYAATGDGLLVALQVLKAVQQSGKSLAQWYDELVLLPQALVNISVTGKSLLDAPAAQSFVAEKSNQLKGTGRLLIRPSGTEPLARVMVEAPDAQAQAERIAAELQALLNENEAA
jgi:phosphoglucosamine mutase